MNWDRRLLFAPLRTLTARGRFAAVFGYTLLVTLWAWHYNGSLSFAWKLPDVDFYMDMARWRYDLVPAPFSARPLAPLLARWIAQLCHASLNTGFTALAYVSLFSSLLVALWLVARSHAPRWTLLAVALVPFWPRLLGIAGLPDPLYTALLAFLLVALEYNWHFFAATLMLPLMLTRESTWLTLACFLLVAGRRLRWGGCALAIGSAALGSVLVRHLSTGSLPNPEHMSGPTYMVGKVFSNGLRSLGVVPWSNVYPMLCGTPAWQHALHLGTVRSVGVCAWSPGGPVSTLGSLLTLFGALPAMFFVLLASRQVFRAGRGALVNFCLLYGAISLFLAPALGTWYSRLFGYAWPLPLIAVPYLLFSEADDPARGGAQQSPKEVIGAFLVLHVFVSAVGETVLLPFWLTLAVALQGLWIGWYLGRLRRTAGIPASPRTRAVDVVK